MKLPSIKLDLPKPKFWDLVTGGALLAGCVLAAANWMAAQGQAAAGSVSNATTFVFVLVQLGICFACLLLLGKTAKLGTIWGNLAAVAGMFVGMSGVLLAAALWAAA